MELGGLNENICVYYMHVLLCIYYKADVDRAEL